MNSRGKQNYRRRVHEFLYWDFTEISLALEDELLKQSSPDLRRAARYGQIARFVPTSTPLAEISSYTFSEDWNSLKNMLSRQEIE